LSVCTKMHTCGKYINAVGGKSRFNLWAAIT
jgi:hypothetical protein